MSPRVLVGWLGCLVLAGCGGSTSSVSSGSDGGTDAPPAEGGGQEGGGAEAGGVTAAQAAADAAHAYCTLAEQCAPAYVSIGYGDEATCEARFKMALLPVFGAPGSSATPAQTEACAKAIPQTSCADLLARKNPAPCQTLPGMLADGAACGADPQCHGTRCRVAPNALCGTCTEPAPAGAPCAVDSDCEPGMTCLKSGACAAYGDENAPCSATQPCRPDLGCVGGKCGTPSPVGTPCTSTDECDRIHGVACDPVAMKCAMFSFAQAGQPCGYVNKGLVECTGPGSFCQGAQPPTYMGSCLAFANDGASCDADAGPLCDVGAVCSGGTCQVPNPSSCH